MSDQRRNLDPHKSARAAMWLFSSGNAEWRDESMDFWETLPDSTKDYCRDMVEDILATRDEDRGES